MALEAFAEAGELGDAQDLTRLVKLHLSSLATSDCVALRAAHGETSLEKLFHADRLLSATKLTRELRAAISSTGKRFLLSVAALGVEDPRSTPSPTPYVPGRRPETWPSATG
jgi:urease accessory protein UreF